MTGGGWRDMSTAPRDGTAIVGQYSGPEHYGDDCGFKHFEVTVRWGQGLGFGAWFNETGGLRSSVANIEAGRQTMSAEQVVDAAAALSCDPRWLLTGWDSGRHAPQPKGVDRKDIRRLTAPIRALLADLEAL